MAESRTADKAADQAAHPPEPTSDDVAKAERADQIEPTGPGVTPPSDEAKKDAAEAAKLEKAIPAKVKEAEGTSSLDVAAGSEQSRVQLKREQESLTTKPARPTEPAPKLLGQPGAKVDEPTEAEKKADKEAEDRERTKTALKEAVKEAGTPKEASTSSSKS